MRGRITLRATTRRWMYTFPSFNSERSSIWYFQKVRPDATASLAPSDPSPIPGEPNPGGLHGP